MTAIALGWIALTSALELIVGLPGAQVRSGLVTVRPVVHCRWFGPMPHQLEVFGSTDQGDGTWETRHTTPKRVNFTPSVS